MQNRRKYRSLGRKFQFNMQNYNAGEVKITFPVLFFCQKSDYFLTFFVSSWDWDIQYQSGYRDGWGYRFWCLSESGLPLIEADLSVTFRKEKKPPYERLFEWLRHNYSRHKSLKNKNMIW